MGDTRPGRAKVCAVCRRILSLLESDDGTRQEWVHGLQDAGGHAPVPVEQDEVKPLYRCDFCNQDDEASFILPVKDFPLPGQSQHMSGEDWSACKACAAHISTGRWAALFKRAVTVWERMHGQKMDSSLRTALQAMHMAVRQNVTGKLYPFVPPVMRIGSIPESPEVVEWGQSRAGGSTGPE
jgi:hypothetical protein